MKHAETCASGARAEIRGPCDCNASPYPWAIRAVDQPDGHSKIEVIVDGPMTILDASMLALTLQDLTVTTIHKDIARRERKANKDKKR